MPKKRRIIIVAGPNGAGKTTFAREYLTKEADCPDFINVDLIAAGISPFDPEQAAIRNIYMDLVDTWEWYDNSDRTPQLIAAGANSK
jgi:predicted ABC-type ATPase